MNNHLRFTDHVKSGFLQLELREILQSPPSVLMGVSQEAEEALKTIKVFTVFDLALSNIFQNATAIVDAHESVAGTLAKYGRVPSDIVDSSAVSKRIAELQNESVQALTGIDSGNGPQVEAALTIKTIRDLALWPPYVASKKLVDLAFNPEALPEFDPEAPADLLPMTGEFPTDKVSYRSIVMIDAPEDEKKLVDLTANGPVDILNKAATGFASPATGAILTYSQSWYPKAVTLGQLLYSLPLAPGESTKIAVIDWTRRTSATTEEDIAQTEKLSNTLVQSRAISEIAKAVAKETQEGSSEATSTSGSVAAGFGAGGLAGPALLGGAIGASGNATKANTFTTSKGKRKLSSEMQQNISSSTQQNAFSARNKRAAIISEATLQEREQISTRTVTNYNHMHALSIQYYEVVQLYQTIVRLEKCERCLFIPMKVLTFNEQAITRFRSVLFDSALNSRIQELLVYATGSVTTNLELRAARRFKSEQDDDTKETAKRAAIRNAKAQAKFRASFQQLQLAGLVLANNDQSTQRSWEMAGTASFVGAYWSGNRVSRMTVKKEDSTQASLGQRTSAPTPPRVHPGLGVAQPISELSTIELEFSAAETDSLQDMTLVFRLNANPSQNLELRCDCILPAHQMTAVLISFFAPMVTSELIDHLNENALYYSQQVWLRSDPSLLALQLAPFTFKNKRVIEYVDPAPVNAAANYLVFRWKDEEDQAWKDWGKENADKTRVEVDTVALPTGGVFAEAVLGRFNSAEKLDITRFWNWQDSPILIQAPDIAAIQAGQHTVTDQPAPGSLESPIVNIQTPPALPDPTGMQAILQTLAASNLFRDMSGITQAAALAQSGLQNASQGAVAGMNQAGANMATFANFQIEMAKILASLAPMLLGLPPVPPPASKNITNAGAAINQGAKMDARQGGAGQAPNPPPIDLGGGGLGGSGGGGSSPGPTTVPDSSGTIFANTGGSRAGAAFDALIGNILPNSGAAVRPINSTTTAGLVDLGSQALPANIDDWQEVFTHVVPNAVIQTLRARNLEVQGFDFAENAVELFTSPINLDLYEVIISQKPRKADGTDYSATELINDIRLHVSDLIDVLHLHRNPFAPSILVDRFGPIVFNIPTVVAFVSKTTLDPFDATIDQPAFTSPNPLGAVMQFNNKVDDMGVVLSKFDALGWIFTTIRDSRIPFLGDVGTHPVSGNRRFGIRNNPDDTLAVFTRGADRSTGVLETGPLGLVFLAGHVIWLSWQAGIVDFVEKHGGFAQIVDPFSKRFNYDKVNQHFRGVPA